MVGGVVKQTFMSAIRGPEKKNAEPFVCI